MHLHTDSTQKNLKLVVLLMFIRALFEYSYLLICTRHPVVQNVTGVNQSSAVKTRKVFEIKLWPLRLRTFFFLNYGPSLNFRRQTNVVQYIKLHSLS